MPRSGPAAPSETKGRAGATSLLATVGGTVAHSAREPTRHPGALHHHNQSGSPGPSVSAHPHPGVFTTNDASEVPRDNQLFGTGNATGLCRPTESTARTPTKTLSFEMSTVLVVTSPTLIACSHSGAVVSR
jgi:hypothetical protein